MNSKDEIIKFRVTAEEKEIIKNYAKIKGISLSDFFRELLTNYENSTNNHSDCNTCTYKLKLDENIDSIISKLQKIKE